MIGIVANPGRWRFLEAMADWELADLSLDSARVRASAAGTDGLLQDFIQDGVMKGRPVPRGRIAAYNGIFRRTTRPACRKDSLSGSRSAFKAASCIRPRTAEFPGILRRIGNVPGAAVDAGQTPAPIPRPFGSPMSDRGGQLAIKRPHRFLAKARPGLGDPGLAAHPHILST